MVVQTHSLTQLHPKPSQPQVKKTLKMHSDKEVALLAQQRARAEAEMYAWVEEAHRQEQERIHDQAERRAQKAKKQKKKKSEKDKKKEEKTKRRGTKKKSLHKPSIPSPARS